MLLLNNTHLNNMHLQSLNPISFMLIIALPNKRATKVPENSFSHVRDLHFEAEQHPPSQPLSWGP